MLVKINAENPEGRKIRQVVETLEEGGIIIYPTDAVYGLGCDIFNQKAVERICWIRKLDPSKAMLSFICKDISQIAEYAHQLDNTVFKLMKRNLPGPFTFILQSNNQVPKLFKNRKRTIGVRIPNNPITLAIVEEFGRPILSASLKEENDVVEYITSPEDFYEEYKNLVNLVVDGGPGRNEPSTVVDCTGTEPVILREGIGELVF